MCKGTGLDVLVSCSSTLHQICRLFEWQNSQIQESQRRPSQTWHVRLGQKKNKGKRLQLVYRSTFIHPSSITLTLSEVRVRVFPETATSTKYEYSISIIEHHSWFNACLHMTIWKIYIWLNDTWGVKTLSATTAAASKQMNSHAKQYKTIRRQSFLCKPPLSYSAADLGLRLPGKSTRMQPSNHRSLVLFCMSALLLQLSCWSSPAPTPGHRLHLFQSSIFHCAQRKTSNLPVGFLGTSLLHRVQKVFSGEHVELKLETWKP